MPACTVFYRFPYAIGSDRPCDIDDTLCGFADAVEVELDRFDGIVDRVADSVPMAQVRSTVTTVYPANATTTVAFDSVDADTADMVNLTADPYTILLPMGGRYLVYASAVGTTVGVGNTVTLRIANLAIADTYLDDASTPIYLNTGGEVRYAPVGVPVVVDTQNPALTVSIGGTAAATFTSVTFGAYWVGDLP